MNAHAHHGFQSSSHTASHTASHDDAQVDLPSQDHSSLDPVSLQVLLKTLNLLDLSDSLQLDIRPLNTTIDMPAGDLPNGTH